MKSAAAALAFACVALHAQTESPQVVGRVIDAVTGQGVPEANVTLYTSAAERYRGMTDSSGSFRLSNLEKGQYQVAVEKSGFVLFAKEPLNVGEGTANPTYALTFVAAQKATLKGRVLDSRGTPLPNASVDLIRGPALRFRTVTDAQGSFSFEKLGGGGYKLRAAPPPNHPGREVATYFPAWVDESAVPVVEIRGDAEVNGFRLVTTPTVHLRGIVRDEDGHPVANANVQLLPVQHQPAHVVVSFDSTFLAIPEGDGTGPAEAELQTDADGAFDFPSVRIGGWQIVARNRTLSGSVSIGVANEDVRMDVQIKAPATISSLPITWAVWDCATPLKDNLCLLNSRKAPEGVAYPIWFQSVDGQSSGLRFVTTGRDSMSDLAGLTPGRYVAVPLPTRALLALPTNGHAGSSFPSIREIDSRAVAPGQPVELDRGSRGFELQGGGYFDGDPALPQRPMPQPGKLRGSAANGLNAFVVIAHQEQGHIWGQLIQCAPDGTFAIDSIGAGNYTLAAFRDMDFERLRDPEILRMVLASDTKVHVSESSTAEIRITRLF
jgi:protocatechuate 3,4-dioxygenase beta subunit